jgi:uncharacterized protein (DUF1697 family)
MSRLGTVGEMGKHYVALLRGINVGGRNKIAMADLRAAFEDHGYEAVHTYIQSGNVLLETNAPLKSLESDIEGLLESRFGVPIVVVLRSHAQLRKIVGRAPDGFGKAPDTYHSDVVFLRAPLTSKQALGIVELRDGVDQVWPGDRVLYFARLSASRAQSRMSRIMMKPEYQLMTIRSWSTTTNLLSLLNERAG